MWKSVAGQRHVRALGRAAPAAALPLGCRRLLLNQVLCLMVSAGLLLIDVSNATSSFLGRL